VLALPIFVGFANAQPQGALDSRLRGNDECPLATDVTHRHLLGLWHAQFEGLAQGATLLLEPHPELAESVRGAINRNGERAQVSGDVDDGEFTLEESVNGVNISATWTGSVEDKSCGTEIRGTWQSAGDPSPRRFVLRKQLSRH
jgi:hypothetical protein